MHWSGRATAGAIALLALGSVVAMVKASLAAGGLPGVASTAWRAAGYFTNLTALIVAFDLASVAVGWLIPARRAAGLVVWMLVIAGVYHLILAPVWAMPGLTGSADLALHTALPAMVVVWWLAFAPKRGLRMGMIAGWLLWPLGYAAYGLARGLATGFWPYPFADLDALGPARLALNVALLSAGFMAAGLVVLASAQALQSRSPP